MSTEHRLLKVGNVELSLDERSTRYNLDLDEPTKETFTSIASGLTSEQLEILAVRILYIASYNSDDSVALLRKYNLPLSGSGEVLEL